MDEFSFPTIGTNQDSSLCQLPFPHFDASPLWFLSSAPRDDDSQLRRSLSEGEGEEAAASIIDAALSSKALNELEDKMDMLWEDFNEELRRVSFELKRPDTVGKAGDRRVGGSSSFNHRRPSLVMLLKMLKKLFLLRKTSSTNQGRPWGKPDKPSGWGNLPG